MAAAVGRALARGEPLIVEAGTGTGKTFAYLVPALLSGRSVIISTGTRTLQDQLFRRDVPMLARALGAAGEDGAAQRARQLSVPASAGAHIAAALAVRAERGHGAAARAGVALGGDHQDRRPRRAHRLAGAIARLADDHLDARELPRPGVPAIRALPRVRGAPRRAGRRDRRREPSFAARRSRAQGRGIRRSAAGCGGRHSGRSASGAGYRRAVLRTKLVGAAGAVSVAGRGRGDGGGRRARARGRGAAGACRVAPRRAARRPRRRGRALRVGAVCRMHSSRRLPAIEAALHALSDELEGLGAGAGTANCGRRAGALAAQLSQLANTAPEAGIRWVDANAAGLIAAIHAVRDRRSAARIRRGAALRLGVHLRDPGDRRGLRAFRRAHRIARGAHAQDRQSLRLSRIRRASICRATCPSRSIRRMRANSSRPARRSSRRAADGRSCSTPAIARLAEGVAALEARFPEPAFSRPGAGPGAARSAARAISRARQCGAARHRQFLGGRGREGRGARHRRHRQAAVRLARRSAAEGTSRGHPPSRRQSLSASTSCRRRCSR